MSRKKFLVILVLEAIFCILLALLQWNTSIRFSSVIAFPMEQLGWALRKLSLSGAMGNAVAIVLFFLLGILPSAVWLVLQRKRKTCGPDWMLHGLTLLLFVTLYYMVNPGLFQADVPGGASVLLGGVFYGVLLGYLVLRLLNRYAEADGKKLRHGLKALLLLLNLMFLYDAFGQSLSALIDSILQLQGSSGLSSLAEGMWEFQESSGLIWTYVFLALHYIVRILPDLLNAVVICLAVQALDAMEKERYGEQAVRSVKRLADVCVKALTAIVVSEIVFHLLQLMFHRQIYQVNVDITIPLIPVIFTLGVLLFARYAQENRKLKQENDLFI